MKGSTTVIAAKHDIDYESGFCTKCGNHEEMIKMDDLNCMYADNTVAISHRRWHARQVKADVRAKELAKTLDHLILQLRTMEEQRKSGEAAWRAAQADEKTKQHEPDNVS